MVKKDNLEKLLKDTINKPIMVVFGGLTKRKLMESLIEETDLLKYDFIFPERLIRFLKGCSQSK